MVPMRSVPHRVVCLVGLDDGVFPRAAGITCSTSTPRPYADRTG
jgi:exonuclease V gamma subunit